jgi:broad specificity phosphatase PhoE
MSEEKSIVLVRHGRPQVDATVPSHDWRLSAVGRDATIALAGDLKDFVFQHILSSPEEKALGTAQAIAGVLGLQVRVDDDLVEHSRRSTGFLTAADFEAAIARLFAMPNELVFGDETADAAFARISAAVERERCNSVPTDVLIVSHGTVMSLYVSRLISFDPFPFWRSLAMPTAIVLKSGRMRVIDVREGIVS